MSDDGLPFFCICDEEMCWCTNMVAHPDEACAKCKNGEHVMEPPS